MRHLLVLVALSGTASVVAAEPAPEVDLDVRPTPSGPPQIEATIIGAPRVPATAISLRDEFDATAMPIAPTSVRSYAEGSEPIAIAIVFSSAEYFVGNDSYEDDPNAQLPGVLAPLEVALAKFDLGKLAPPGSEATVVSYAVGAAIRMPMAALTALDGRVLGTQHDYRNQIGNDLVSGITLGLHELALSTAPRKALIVIGDGNDTNNPAAKIALAELKRQAVRDNIQTFAIIYKSVISDPGNVITTMIPAAHTVSSGDDIASELLDISAQLADRYYVTFSGEALQWDGRDHDLVVQLGHQQLESIMLELPGHPPAIRSWPWSWLAQLGIGVVLLVGLGLLRWRMATVKAAMAVRAP